MGFNSPYLIFSKAQGVTIKYRIPNIHEFVLSNMS